MIPAPDAMRCTSTHPDDRSARCFRVAHGDEGLHQHELPNTSPTYHATWVRTWRTGPAPASEFPEGPHVDTPAKM